MEDLGIDVTNVKLSIVNLFGWQAQQRLEEKIEKYKEVMGMRERMIDLGINATDIDKANGNIFKVPPYLLKFYSGQANSQSTEASHDTEPRLPYSRY